MLALTLIRHRLIVADQTIMFLYENKHEIAFVWMIISSLLHAFIYIETGPARV